MNKPKRTRVRALEGRVIEKVTIHGNYDGEADQNFMGPSLEIRCVGGVCFSFTAAPIPAATAELWRDNNGNVVKGDDEPKRFT